MASCNLCGGPCEANEDGLVLLSTCSCISRRLPSLEVDPDGICPRCGAGASLEGYCEECEDNR